MVDREQPKHPTHRAYSVARREGQEDFWPNIGHKFLRKDNGGFKNMLQANPFDGEVVSRESTESDEATEQPAQQSRQLKAQAASPALYDAKNRRNRRA